MKWSQNTDEILNAMLETQRLTAQRLGDMAERLTQIEQFMFNRP